MTLAGSREPQSAPSPSLGILALDGSPRYVAVRTFLEVQSCPWPRAAESKSTKDSTVPDGAPWDIVDEWGVQSFPASDPPANW